MIYCDLYLQTGPESLQGVDMGANLLFGLMHHHVHEHESLAQILLDGGVVLVELLQVRIVAQKDVSLQAVLVVRIDASTHTAVCVRQKKTFHVKLFLLNLQPAIKT